MDADKDAIEFYLGLERIQFKSFILCNYFDEIFSQDATGLVSYAPNSGRKAQLSRKQQIAVLYLKKLLRSVYEHAFEFHASLGYAKPESFLKARELLPELRKSEKKYEVNL